MEALYRRYDDRRWVHPDPLEFLYRYEDVRDREIVALVASSLAYGRVKQILRSVETVLAELGPRPGCLVASSRPGELRRRLADFRHRFDTGRQVTDMLLGARRLVWLYGSLEACFAAGVGEDDPTLRPAMRRFVGLLDPRHRCGHLLPRPARGSACKRLWLMLRWLVRRDAVDPGGWNPAWRSRLVVPLDTHMHKIGLELGFTTRRSADFRTAVDITRSLAAFDAADPTKYDFALTRLGIRDDAGNLPGPLARLTKES
ncbi:MAG: TIGR02757 family protein [Phycisphaerae bacterium]